MDHNLFLILINVTKKDFFGKMYFMIFCGKSAQGLILEVYLGIDQHETKNATSKKWDLGNF